MLKNGVFICLGLNLPRLLSHYKDPVSFLPLSPLEVLVIIKLTLEEGKAESKLESLGGLDARNPGLVIQRPNH